MEKKVLVTAEDRQRMKNEAIKYGKDDVFYKLVNFDKEIPRLRKSRSDSKLVTIMPVKEDIYKTNSSSYSFVKDHENDVYYGIPVGLLPDGNIRWRRIYLEEKYTFNLDNDMDCKMFIVMRMHPHVEGSPFEADPKFKIHDPEWEAEMVRMKAKLTRQAFTKIDELTGKNLVYFCRNLGIINDVLKETTSELLISRLEGFAMENPFAFMDRYDQADRSVRETIHSAVQLSIIRDKGADGYHFDGIFIGLSHEQMTNYMKLNPDLYIRLAHAIEEVDVTTKSILEEEKKSGKKPGRGNGGNKEVTLQPAGDDM